MTLLTPSRHGFLLPPPKMSLAQVFGKLPPETQDQLLSALEANEIEELMDDWRFLARREQLPPANDWSIWMMLCGAGFGKTRALVEYGIFVLKHGIKERTALIAPTVDDLWRTDVYGPDGFQARAPAGFQPSIHRQDRVIHWPNGSIINLFTAEEPERLRGPSHDLILCEEMAAWAMMADPQKADERLDYIWRLAHQRRRHGSSKPETVVATTPRPRRLIKQLYKDFKEPKEDSPKIVITGGSTFENAQNLPEDYVQDMRREAKTRLGRQEVYAELLEELEGSLWSIEMIERNRVDKAPELKRVVVAVDPAVSSKEESDFTGIVVVGLGSDGLGYVLEDATIRATPDKWAKKVSEVFSRWQADKVVVEKNQGGDMVSSVLWGYDKSLPIKTVHASRGKYIRAEPIAAHFERDKVKLVGHFPELEEQMRAMDIGRMKNSPDRCDSMVYGIHEIMPATGKRAGFFGRKLNV